MKNVLCVALVAAGLFLIGAVGHLSAQTLEWAKNTVGGGSRGRGVAVDAAGNSYVTGNFVPNLTFDGITLTSGFFFVAKYDVNGSVIWAKSAASRDGNGIAVDASGNSYVTGEFLDTATFDGITLTGAGFLEIFVVKYDANGNVVWAKSAAGSPGSDRGYGIAVDASGNSYVIGQFVDTATFDGIVLTTADVNFAGVFVAKYDANGNVVWAKGPALGSGAAIAVDASGNSYVTGGIPENWDL